MSINSVQGNYQTVSYETPEASRGGGEYLYLDSVSAEDVFTKSGAGAFTSSAAANAITAGLTPINTGMLGSGTYYEANGDGTYTIYTQGGYCGAPLEEKETLTKEEFKEQYPQVEISTSDTSEETEAADLEKSGFFKSLGNGLVFDFKQIVPFWGSKTVGDIEYQHKAIVEELTNGDEYNINDDEKGTAKTIGKGIVTKLAYCIPIYGTYKLGKEALENEYAYNKLTDPENTGEYEKPGFFKSLGKGIIKSLALMVPVLSAYTKGKDIDMQNQIYEELKEREAASETDET